jgi:hypothetical protein
MCRRISTATAGLVTTLMMTVGAVQAFEGAKYPDWTGGWRRWAPSNAVREAGNGGTNVTAGGQPSFDQTKPWGLGQEAPPSPPAWQTRPTAVRAIFSTTLFAVCPPACR